MTERDPIVEYVRNAIVAMLQRRQDMKAARWVNEMDIPLDPMLFPRRETLGVRPGQPVVTFADHLGVLNCPGLYSAAQHAESMAEVFGAHRMP